MTIETIRLDEIPLFSEAPKELIEYVRSNSQLIYLKPRQIVYNEGKMAKTVFLVLHGGLKVQKTYGKDITIFDFITRGSLGGYLYRLETNRIYMFTGIAVEHSSVLAIPSEVFENFLLKCPSCFRKVQLLTGKFMNEMQQDRSLAKERVPVRLANFFLNMIEKQGPLNCSNIMIKLSRHDIAGRIGTEPETIIRILTKWTQLGVIETKNKIITIKRRDYLADLIEEKS